MWAQHLQKLMIHKQNNEDQEIRIIEWLGKCPPRLSPESPQSQRMQINHEQSVKIRATIRFIQHLANREVG